MHIDNYCSKKLAIKAKKLFIHIKFYRNLDKILVYLYVGLKTWISKHTKGK